MQGKSPAGPDRGVASVVEGTRVSPQAGLRISPVAAIEFREWRPHAFASTQQETAANIAASALLLTIGLGLVANHPHRIPEQVKEQRDKTGGDTGDPPS